MKKLISVMLVLCMVLALVPAMAFAATPDGAVAMVGEDNYYDDLQDAIDAASAPDAKTNRVDIVDDAEVSGLVISGNVVLQLNGHTLEGESGVLGVPAPAVTVNVGATLTIQGPGSISAHGGATNAAVLGNAGTMVIDKSAKITGVIFNTGVLTVESATVKGSVINSGTVTVNGGTFEADSAGTPLFTGKGKVTINGGHFKGDLDKANDSCPGMTVNGGAFTDAHAILHTTSPVAGVYGIGGTKDVNGYEEYWIGAAAMVTYANANKKLGGTVDFLFGDVKVDGMPTAKDGWGYWDSWDSYYDDVEEKYLRYTITIDGDKYYCDGRGLVNSLSDLNVVASKYSITSPSKDPIANSVLNQNAKYVKSVTSYATGVNKNEVFVTIEITADLSELTEFKVPEGFSGWGNKNGTHQWVPITVKFTDLNGSVVPAYSNKGVVARDAWNTAITYNTSSDNCFHIWVGLDHYILGSNASFDFADMRYGDHGLIYRCTVVVKDVDVDLPVNSEPDDTTGAAAIPSESGSGTATSAPAGTNAPSGDGPARTGDNSTVMLWATLLVASAAGVAICVVDEAKKRSRK